MLDENVQAQLDRIEHMLAVLVDALADDDVDPDGDEFGSERDQGQEL